MIQKSITDKFIHAELNLPQGEEIRKAKVIGQSKDESGNVTEYAANVIAENLFLQVDTEGHLVQMLDSIIDYMKDVNSVGKA